MPNSRSRASTKEIDQQKKKRPPNVAVAEALLLCSNLRISFPRIIVKSLGAVQVN